jgi:hypothetical protein
MAMVRWGYGNQDTIEASTVPFASCAALQAAMAQSEAKYRATTGAVTS